MLGEGRLETVEALIRAGMDGARQPSSPLGPWTGEALDGTVERAQDAHGVGRGARTGHAGVEEEATFSPDDRSVAYVKGHNVFCVTIGGDGEKALTSDGTDVLLNDVEKLNPVGGDPETCRTHFSNLVQTPGGRPLPFDSLP